MNKRTLDLWPIGNCQTSALIDREGRMIWACLPRVDGEPIFSALLSDDDYADPQARGYWAIELEGVTSITQEYVRNTPILRTRQMRSEEHTSELQSLMRNSYAVFCLKKKKK